MKLRHSGLFVIILSALIFSGPAVPAFYQAGRIGTKSFAWTDRNRIDSFYGEKEYREVNVRIWYPADPRTSGEAASQIAPLIPNLEKASPLLLDVSRETVARLLAIETVSRWNPEIAGRKGPYPVLIFSPSLGGLTAFYSSYAERLAEAGYVVVGVDHKFESWFILNQQGRVIPQDHRFHDELKELRIPEDISADEYRERRGVRLKVLGEDLIFVLNELSKINRTEFGGILDLESVGVFGHSVGGAAAMEAAKLDPRITAVVNFDGTPSGRVLREGMRQPFMMIEDRKDLSQRGNKIQFDRRKALCEKVRSDCYRVLIPGADHNSFSEYGWRMTDDPKEKRRRYVILDATFTYLRLFFNRHLLNEEDDWSIAAKGVQLDVELIRKPGSR
jgi:dienelactone hydrolase